MRIQFNMEGGFAYLPGLSKSLSIDTEALPAQEATELEDLVYAAHFFNQPAQVGVVAPGAADYRYYTIKVEEDRQSHTIQVLEPVKDPALHALVEHLRAKVQHKRLA